MPIPLPPSPPPKAPAPPISYDEFKRRIEIGDDTIKPTIHEEDELYDDQRSTYEIPTVLLKG